MTQAKKAGNSAREANAAVSSKTAVAKVGASSSQSLRRSSRISSFEDQRLLDGHGKKNSRKQSVEKKSDKSTLFSKDRTVLEIEQTVAHEYLYTLEKKRLDSKWMKSGLFQISDWQMNEIFRHLYSSQGDCKDVRYMEKQEAVNAKMRSILIDWLAEVHHRFKLRPVTLWLAVNILDRYLKNQLNVAREKLQLVGVTALFIACKCYNKSTKPHPGVRESVYITDNAYRDWEVRNTEAKILEVLDFRVYVPTGYQFLERYLDVIDAEELVQHLALFYAERNLQEYDSLELPPHHMAAAALYAALVYVNQFGGKARVCQPTWCPALVRESGLSEAKLIPAARQLLMHVNESPQTSKNRKLNAIWKKYVSERYMNVSQLPIPSI